MDVILSSLSLMAASLLALVRGIAISTIIMQAVIAEREARQVIESQCCFCIYVYMYIYIYIYIYTYILIGHTP